jgi:MFS family permease
LRAELIPRIRCGHGHSLALGTWIARTSRNNRDFGKRRRPDVTASLWLGAEDALAQFGVFRGQPTQRDNLIAAALQGKHVQTGDQLRCPGALKREAWPGRWSPGCAGVAVGHDGRHDAIRLPGLFSEMLRDRRIPTAELRQLRRCALVQMYRMSLHRPSLDHPIRPRELGSVRGEPSGVRVGSVRQALGSSAAPSAAGIRRVLRLVSVLFVVESAMYAAVVPLLPHYAHLLGLSKTAAGVLAASYSAGLIAGSLLGWWLAVRVGVRSTTLVGLALFAGASLAFGLGGSVVVLDGWRAAQGLASGCIWGGGLTWLVAAAPRERIGKLIGVAVGAAIFGTVTGPVIGTVAATVSTGATFGAVGLIALCLMGWVARVPAPAAQRVRGTTSVLSALRHDRALALGGWIIALEAMAWGVSSALIPLRLSRLGAAQLAIGAVFLLSSAVAVGAAPFVGGLSDRLPPPLVIGAGLLISSPLLIAIGIVSSPVALGVLTIVCVGGALSALAVPASALVTHSAERVGVALAAAIAMFNSAFAIGETIGAPAGAAVAQATSDLVPFAALAVLMLATFAAMRIGGRPGETTVASAEAPSHPPPLTARRRHARE